MSDSSMIVTESGAEVDPSGVVWPTDPSQFELTTKIGQGAFAAVWRASTTVVVNSNHNSGDGEDQQESSSSSEEQQHLKVECAIKILNLDHVDSNLAEIRLEVQSMRLSSHPNVLSCFAAFVRSTDLWLVTQLMRKGSSLHCLQCARRNSGQKPMEDHILYIVHETLLGLRYIHEHNGQIHRDIKAGNILVDHNGDVRIADFGVSGWLVKSGTQQEKAKTFVGTPCWMAPEVMEQINGYDYKADIWSLGITAMELAKGYAPYAKYPPMKVLILTIQEDPPSLDTYDEEDGDDVDNWLDSCENAEEFSTSFRSFVDGCLQKNPSKRPTTSELLQSKPISRFSDPVYLEERKKAFVEEVCNLVEDVGSPSLPVSEKMPGHSPVSIFLSKEENNRPAGTTWVFADGSQVLSSSMTNEASVDDVLDEIDQFGQQTGGEHYSRGGDPQAPPTQQPDDENDDEDDEDLNAFMDEFEMNTQGENFRRPKTQAE